MLNERVCKSVSLWKLMDTVVWLYFFSFFSVCNLWEFVLTHDWDNIHFSHPLLAPASTYHILSLHSNQRVKQLSLWKINPWRAFKNQEVSFNNTFHSFKGVCKVLKVFVCPDKKMLCLNDRFSWKWVAETSKTISLEKSQHTVGFIELPKHTFNFRHDRINVE